MEEPKIDNAITEQGIRENLNEGIEYMAFWTIGTGCCVVNYLMADAATCEVSRAQLWIWLKYKAKLDDGRVVDEKLIDKLIEEELNKIFAELEFKTLDKNKEKEAPKKDSNYEIILDEKGTSLPTFILYKKILAKK